MDKFHIYSPLGPSTSTTYRGRERHTINFVAIKRCAKDKMDVVSRSVGFLHRLKGCENVVGFGDWYETQNNLWLILEYLPGGPLSNVLESDKRLPEKSVMMFGLDILRGLVGCWKKGVVLGGIRPEKVMISEYGVLKLSDFTCATKVPTKRPPDQASEPLSFAGDVMELGRLMYRMYYGSYPPSSGGVDYGAVGGDGLSDTLNKTASDTPPGPELVGLLSGMLRRESYERLSPKEVCEHPFWRGALGGESDGVPRQRAWDAYWSARGKDVDSYYNESRREGGWGEDGEGESPTDVTREFGSEGMGGLTIMTPKPEKEVRRELDERW